MQNRCSPVLCALLTGRSLLVKRPGTLLACYTLWRECATTPAFRGKCFPGQPDPHRAPGRGARTAIKAAIAVKPGKGIIAAKAAAKAPRHIMAHHCTSSPGAVQGAQKAVGIGGAGTGYTHGRIPLQSWEQGRLQQGNFLLETAAARQSFKNQADQIA